MKARLLFLLKSYLFWIVLFILCKFIFLIYQYEMTIQTPILLCCKSIWNGIIMDVAMTSYVIMVFCTVLAVTFFLSGKKLSKVFKITNTLFLSTFLLVIVIDLEIYRNWGFHLDVTPLQYLKTPKEAAASTPVTIYILMISIFFVLRYFSSKFFKIFLLHDLEDAKKSLITTYLSFLY